MNGEELYDEWREVNQDLNVGTQKWEDLEENERDAWEALSERVRLI